MIFLNKDNIPPQIINKIRTGYIKNPDFNPSLIRSVSSACEGLCKWVIAISSYDKIYKVKEVLFSIMNLRLDYLQLNCFLRMWLRKKMDF